MTLERDAIEVLASKGWIKGQMRSPRGVCLMGACHDAAGVDQRSFWIGDYAPNVEEVIREQFPDRISNLVGNSPVPEFNDHEDTVIDDVILVLEKSAIRTEEQV